MGNCNCKKNDIPRIVKGSDFTIVVDVERPVLSYKEKFDLRECTDISVVIVSRFGKRTSMPYTITEDGRLQVDFDENTPIGLYGFEITGKDSDGKDWRFYAKPGEWIQVVDASTDEHDPDHCNCEPYYDKTVEFGFATVSSELLAKMRLAVKSEDSRVASENDRKAAETERAEAETSRADAEKQRADAEDKRLQAENIRLASEDSRVASENDRKAAETERAEAETSRADAEKQRADDFSTLKSTAENAVTAANDATERANKAVDEVENKIKETLAITLSCNHDDNIIGKKVYIKNSEDDSVLEEHEWQGETIKTSVMPDKKYYVECEEFEGYTLPKSDKFTAISGNVRELSLAYESEWFYPSLQMEDGTDCEGTDCVMYYGQSEERVPMKYIKGMIVKIPFGKRYQLIVKSKTDYYAGIFKARVAKDAEYKATVTYKAVRTNIGIQMIDGSILAASEWDDTKYDASEVNGIFMFTTTVQLIIYCAKSESRVFGGSGKPVGYDELDDTSTRGEIQTEALVKDYAKDSTYAPGYCYNTILLSGRRCYLPTLDELTAMYANRNAINECSRKVIGVDIITNDSKWSSDLRADNTSDAWYFFSSANTNLRGDSYACIPVSAL